MLESPGKRLEFGHTGNLGRLMPRYQEGVTKRAQDGDPNPIGYLWQTMPDGQSRPARLIVPHICLENADYTTEV